MIFGAAAKRLPNTSLFAAPGIKAETALIDLDLGGLRGVFRGGLLVGQGHGLPCAFGDGVARDLVSGAIRVSIGPTTSENEIDLFLEAWSKLVAGLSRDKGGLAA